MITDRELLKQALEALEAETSDSWECNSYHPKIHSAITALRQALEVEQQVEPVAYFYTVNGHIVSTEASEKLMEQMDGEPDRIPLYTFPLPIQKPQEAQQPLTDKQILDFVKTAPALDTAEAEWLHVARAIERAHHIGGAA